jgi:hypothetical protein
MKLALWPLSVILMAGAWPATADEPSNGTRPGPLVGERYRTLRALAQYLDRTARGALEGATDDVRHGTPSGSEEARFLFAVRSFARSAAAFDRRVGDYQARPFEVPPEVSELATTAREVSGRLRAAHALESTYDEWDGVMDVLERMSLLLAGGEVTVPAAHVAPALSGPDLAELRRLAHDLDLSSTRAHATAKRTTGNYARGEQFLGELGYFAAQSRDLHLRADTANVDPQLMGPIVHHLLEEARLADRRMRDAKTFTEVWDDSGRTITILERMATLVRS